MESRGISASSSASMSGRAGASWSLAGGPSEGLIRPRPRVGPLAAVLLAVLFSALASPLVMADRLLGGDQADGTPTSISLRAPIFFGAEEPTGGGLIAARGEVVTAGDLDLAARVSQRMPAGPIGWALVPAALFLLALVVAAAVRRGHRGRWLRSQLAMFGLVLVVAAAAKAALLLSAISVFAIPVAAVALAVAAAVEPRAGLFAGLLAALVVTTLVPIDGGVAAVLLAQVVAAALVGWGHPRGGLRLVVAGIAAAVAGAAAFAGVAALAWSTVDLAHPGLVAAAIGGLASIPLALALAPLLSRLLGDPGARRLANLQAFSNPLLQQIADRAPGTWVHSLAVANMAEAATAAIGADAALARTGAYYHDLGKSLQPKYFAENLGATEPSPHEGLAPEVSADVIAAHVTEGVRSGRSAGLPERVIDFMHMHHARQPIGDLWKRYGGAGKPGGLFEDHFRYPGELPQTRETGVLAICDAVENAWRSGEGGDVGALIRRVVYDRLDSGQLDESGLSVADLRAICAALATVLAETERPAPEQPKPSRTSEQRDAATVAMRKPAAAADPVADPNPAPDPVLLDKQREPRPPTPPPPSEVELVSELAGKAATALGHASGVDDNVGEPVTMPLRRTQSGVPIPAPPPRQPAVEALDDLDVTNPVNPAPPAQDKRRQRARPGPRTEQLSEWEEALSVVDEPGASGSRARPKKSTIELLGGAPPGDDELEPSILSPGTLVIGPPPETHPGVDKTVERQLPIPPEGIRPSKRRTREREVVVPSEAFPDDTEPSVIAIGPPARDDNSD